ncbi:MAG: HlyD family efflux transporter periplasmic adaptor subunit [Clostridiales bacterium]|nr:HlyD family efflux transporter periplasmic adaptor subunit [Clostridiales bacterium]
MKVKAFLVKVKEFLKRRRKWCVIGVILVAALAVGASFVSRARKAQAMLSMAPTQETAEVERRSLMETVSATGTVTSAQSKSVSVALSGVEILEMNVKVGDSVEAGDIICVLDSSDLEEDLADAQTTLNATSGKTAIELASAERGLSEAETTRDIETARAYEDEDEAYNDYLKAVTDEEEAEDEYLEAQEATVIKNGEWEAAQEDLEDLEDELEEAEKALEAAQKTVATLEAQVSSASSGASATSLETEFASTVAEIQSLVSASGNSGSKDASSYLYITNSSLGSYSATDFVGADATEETVKSINEKLATLEGLVVVYAEEAGGTEATTAAYNAAVAAYDEAYAYYQEVYAEYQEAVQAEAEWESKYNSAKSSENSYESAYESAIKNTDSYNDTYRQKVRSTEDTIRSNDSTVSGKEDSLATSQLSATTADLSEKQQIRELEKQIEDCTVTSPIAGVITSLNFEEGDTYSTANSAIAVIENTAAYEVEAEIDEYDISLIEVGQQVVVKTNGTGDTELDGTVTEVSPRASSDSSSDVVYQIKVSIDTPCEDLRLDMTAKLSIIIESKDNVLTVPYDAVQEEEDGTYYVEVVEDNAASGETGDTQAAEAPVTEGTSEEETAQESEETQEQAKAGEAPQGGRQPGGNGDAGGAAAVSSRKITVEKGIESDYYIEVISDEITEGMQVIVPATEDSGTDFGGMVGRQGPMGGF